MHIYKSKAVKSLNLLTEIYENGILILRIKSAVPYNFTKPEDDMTCFDGIISRFISESLRIFGTHLTGIYLHGSAAMNCFNPLKSDIDLLFVIDGEISEEQKLDFLGIVLELNKLAPPKGLELSIVKEQYCKPFMYPTPYEFHYSNAFAEEANNAPLDMVRRLHGTDRDLAAHFTITYHRGITVYGKEIREVFELPPKEHYTDSIIFDIENARDDIVNCPVYIILNLCRVLAYVREELVLSKKEGGEWGVVSLPQKYGETVKKALSEYTDNSVTAYNEEELINYADYMLEEIYKSAEK